MLDFVPLAGAGGQVADRDLDAELVGQLLQFAFPQPDPRAVAAATVTPFNGEHDAGIQVLNTSNFPIDFQPLRCLPDRSSCPVFVGSH